MMGPLKNPRFQVVIVVGLLTLGSFYVWWVTKYEPTQQEIVQLSQQEAALRSSNEESRRTIANLGIDELRELIDEADRRYRVVQEMVPPDTLRDPLLSRITTMAREFDVDIEHIQPRDPTPSGEFVVGGFDLRVVGRYHDVGAFITQLLSLERITQVRSAMLQATQLQAAGGGPAPGGTTSGGEPGGGGWAVRVAFTLLTYAFPTDEAGDSAQVSEVAS